MNQNHSPFVPVHSWAAHLTPKFCARANFLQEEEMVGKTKTFEKGKEKSKTLQALRIRPSGPALTSHIVLNGTNAVALSEDGDTNTSATLLKCHQKKDGTG